MIIMAVKNAKDTITVRTGHYSMQLDTLHKNDVSVGRGIFEVQGATFCHRQDKQDYLTNGLGGKLDVVIGGGKAIPSTINYRIQYIISSATIEGSQKEHQMFVCYMGNLIL